MRALLALVILSATLLVGACSSSSSSTSPTLAPLPTEDTTLETPSLEPEASPS